MGDGAAGKPTILLVDDDADFLESTTLGLEEDYNVVTETNPDRVLDLLQEQEIDVVVCDLDMGADSIRGDKVHERVRNYDPDIPFILNSGVKDLELWAEYLDKKIFDVLRKGDGPKELENAIKKAVNQLEKYEELLHRPIEAPSRTVIGDDPRMIKVFEIVDMVAKKPSPVLIQGEPGTGKELIAHEVHRKRNEFLRSQSASFTESDHPYLAVNCGALSRTLLESQLFGHKKGAFTGSVADQDGVFVAAKSGTLFLDEITELDLDLQVKLLRALQEKEVTPVGSTEALPVRARVITATNRPIQELVREGKFRADLYYRIDVVQIEVPALRDRPQDIEPLVKHFLWEVANLYNAASKSVTAEALELLKGYSWPGNVRELHNVIERSFALGDSLELQTGDLPDEIRFGGGGITAGLAGFQAAVGQVTAPPRQRADAVPVAVAAGSEFPTYDEVVAEHIRRALLHTRGVKSRAATLLSIDRNRLYRLMSKYQIPADGVTAE